MGKKYVRVDKRRWPGVYCYESSKRKHLNKPDVCYVINYRIDGKLSWEKVGWKSEGYTPAIAAETRSDRIRQARHGDDVKTQKEIRRERTRTDRSLGEVADAYFKAKKEFLKGESHRIDQGRYNKHVAPLLGARRVSSLCVLDVERVKRNMAALSKTSIWSALEIMRRIINFGAKSGLCPRLSFIIDMPRKDNEVVEYLTSGQMTRLNEVLDNWPSRDVARMLRLAMFTGMRRGEIFALEDQDLDFRQSLIIIRDPKGGKTSSVPMNDAARAVLESQLQWKAGKGMDSPYVFPGLKGRKRTHSNAVGRIKEKAELPRSFRIFHGLRHHFAVTLANSGEFSLDMIGDLLTHKSAVMTRRYAQFLPGTLKQASVRASEILKEQISGEVEQHQRRVG